MVNLTIKKRKAMKSNETENPMTNPERDFEDYKAVYECYKDKSFDQQIFLALYVLRVSLFNIIVSYLYKNPLPQAILILLLNLAMVVYLVIKKPMKKLINLIQQLTIESILLVFNICVLILAFADNANSDSIGMRNNIGEVMSAINIIMPTASMALIAVKLLLIAKEFYDDYKLSKKVEKLPQFSQPKIRNHGISSQPRIKFSQPTETSPVLKSQEVESKAQNILVNQRHNIIQKKIKSRKPKELRQLNHSSIIIFFLSLSNLGSLKKPAPFQSDLWLHPSQHDSSFDIPQDTYNQFHLAPVKIQPYNSTLSTQKISSFPTQNETSFDASFDHLNSSDLNMLSNQNNSRNIFRNADMQVNIINNQRTNVYRKGRKIPIKLQVNETNNS